MSFNIDSVAFRSGNKLSVFSQIRVRCTWLISKEKKKSPHILSNKKATHAQAYRGLAHCVKYTLLCTVTAALFGDCYHTFTRLSKLSCIRTFFSLFKMVCVNALFLHPQPNLCRLCSRVLPSFAYANHFLANMCRFFFFFCVSFWNCFQKGVYLWKKPFRP